MTTQRVAILGGGLSGLVTALNLTAPEQRGRYSVTVYQLGWRLGGKCATGRNADIHDSIQEHGLHVFMGQYANAFALVQGLYAEAADPPFANWRDGFTEQGSMTLMEEVDGEWLPWVINAPVFPGTPGLDPQPNLFGRLIQILQWIGRNVEEIHESAFCPGTSPEFRRALVQRAIDRLGAIDPAKGTPRPRDQADAAAALDHLHRWMAGCIARQATLDNELRRFWILAELSLASLIGSLRDGLLLFPEANLERVNELDYKAWLRSHGAGEAAVESAPVRSLYDLIFAYPEGKWQSDGDVEAGTMFLSLLNTACYQGSLIWKFNTATGDLIMTPF